LCICRTEPSWTGLALQLDRLGCSAPRFRWCSSQTAAAGILREEALDAVILGDPSEGDSDPIVFLEALREAGFDAPVLVLSPRVDDAWLLRCGELDVEIFPAAAGWESRALAVWIRRTIERSELEREHQRLLLADRRRQSDNRESSDLIVQQLQRISAATDNSGLPCPIAPELRKAYAELLRTYVFFGGGRLDDEVDRLSRAIQAGNLPAGERLRLHCDCLESLLCGCGRRSVRHLQQNADLLALEILIRVADGYRCRSRLPGLGDHGIDLLHAESLWQKQRDG
jgi:hypothetical protein